MKIHSSCQGTFAQVEDEALFLLGVLGSGGHRESVTFLDEDEDTSWSIGSLLVKMELLP